MSMFNKKEPHMAEIDHEIKEHHTFSVRPLFSDGSDEPRVFASLLEARQYVVRRNLAEFFAEDTGLTDEQAMVLVDLVSAKPSTATRLVADVATNASIPNATP